MRFLIAVVGIALVMSACSGSVVPAGQGSSTGTTTESAQPTDSPSPTPLQVNCPPELKDFLTALEDLNSRLDIGLNFPDYSTKVGDVKVAYDKINFDKLDLTCVSGVGVPAEKALNDYIDAYNTWNVCVSSVSCTNDSIKSKLQAKWSDATKQIDAAKKALNS